MKYLLEKWSLKGGTLTQLEEALLHLDMKHIVLGKLLAYINIIFTCTLVSHFVLVSILNTVHCKSNFKQNIDS